MRSGHTQFFGAIAVVTLVVALAGCGGEKADGSPTPASPTTAASAASDSGGGSSRDASDSGGAESDGRTKGLPPENEALKAPDKADYLGIKYPTDQGAQAAAKYFFDAMFYGHATGDTTPFAEIIDQDSCSTCSDTLDQIVQWRSQKKFIGRVSVSPNDIWVDEKNDQYFVVQYQYSIGEVPVFVNGERESSLPGKSFSAAVKLRFADDHWQVIDAAWKDRQSDD
ncbi:Uncharacterised protein [Mycobacteroides abscessus subsp. abscessus]|nr:Uncharacterised protein [Mycobacteroides abscessus subsp. abscessus]